MLIIYGSNIYRCCNVPLGGRFVGTFGTRLTCTRLAGLAASAWIFPLLDAQMESELSLRLMITLSNLITLVILYQCVMNNVIADVMCYL